MKKICQVIFSTNRLEYLTKTLHSQSLLNFDGCKVDKIFIDDYPKDRDDNLITSLVSSFGYKEIYLHADNLGLSATWTEFWNLIKNRNYDYIWHQEDDVEILQPIKILDLVDLLEQNSILSQVVLKRQAWYPHESDPMAFETDIIYKDFRLEKYNLLIFSPMASLYSMDRVRFPYSDWYGQFYPTTNFNKINLNEGMIGKALYEETKLLSGHLKSSSGRNLVNHIGDYFVGKKVLPDEPHYDQFSRYDPNKKYCSKTGNEY
jgi:hypothetical protein